MLQLDFSDFPLLENDRLLLRKIDENDLDEMYALRSDPEIMKHIDRPLAGSKDDVLRLINIIKDFLDKNSGITWGITLKSDDKLIGTIGIWRIEAEHFRGEIGYLLNPVKQGQGIMQEAMDLIIPYTFKTLKLHAIEACVNPKNERSIKLLEKNGFVKEAFFKDKFYFEGKFVDTCFYTLFNTYSD